MDETRTPDEFQDSVAGWIKQLGQGDDDAAADIWEAFFPRIVALARVRLKGARRESDEDDVAASVFESLYRGVVDGRLAQVGNRDELWRLLAAITQRKVADHLRHRTRVKRGSGAVRGDSAFISPDGRETATGFDTLPGTIPEPDLLAIFNEEYERLPGSLRDDTLRRVVVCRMEGYSNSEIAQQLGITERAVERKLQLIRDKWRRVLKD